MAEKTDSTINFEALFQSLGTAYIVFKANDPEFTVIGENDAHAEVAMVERKDVIGKPVLEAFPDTSEEFITKGESRLLDSIRKVIATGKPDTMPDLSYDLKNKEGILTPKVWEVTHYPFFENGEVTAVFQQTKDITENITTRQELALAQNQLEQALAYGEVGTWIWNVSDDVVVGDKNLAKLFGIGDGTKQVEVSLNEFMKAIHPDDVDRVQQAIESSLADDAATFESEYRTFDYNGNIRWLLARGHTIFDAAGNPLRFPGLVMDITERKIAENNLHMLAKANTQFPASLGYKQTLDAIAAIIVPSVADWCAIDILEDGKIEQVVIAHKDPEKVEWAKQMRVKQGPVDPDAMTGSAWVIRTGIVEYIPVVTDEALVAAAKDEKQLKLLREIGIHSVITAPLKIDGKTIGALSFMSTESHRHYDKNDLETAQALANRAALAVYNANLFKNAKTEIDERKKLQSELETLNAALEDRVKDRTLRLEKTNQGLKNEIERRHQLESQRLQHYIDLNKTKDEFISLASHQLRTPATGVKQYLGMVLEGLLGDIDDGQAAVLRKAYESNERQLTIVSDLLKVAQVDSGKVKLRLGTVDIKELVTDVIKEQQDTYAMRRQHVEFTVPTFKTTAVADPEKIRMVFENMIDNASKYSDPGKSIKVSINEQKDTFVVSIKDNGVGVAPEDVDKLFEKFNRIHNHLSNHVGGTGLGLYWAKKVVDLHGGMIDVASVLGEGSVFSVHLPKNTKIPLKAEKIGALHEK